MKSYQMKIIVDGLKRYYDHAEEAEQMIINYALLAGGANAVGGMVPGLAIPATIMACFVAVWGMYADLCKTLGISIKENVLKLLARAALANITANLGGVLIASFAGMFVPGASIIVSSIVAFVSVYLAGFIFLQLILKMAEKSKDKYSFSDISTKDMKDTIKKTKLDKEDLNAARYVYEQNKK